MTLQVIDLTPRVGSEIRTDVETLMSGSEAATGTQSAGVAVAMASTQSTSRPSIMEAFSMGR